MQCVLQKQTKEVLQSQITLLLLMALGQRIPVKEKSSPTYQLGTPFTISSNFRHYTLLSKEHFSWWHNCSTFLITPTVTSCVSVTVPGNTQDWTLRSSGVFTDFWEHFHLPDLLFSYFENCHQMVLALPIKLFFHILFTGLRTF